MKPIEIELHRVRMPLLRAHVAAHGREQDREVVLVRVVLDDGTEGWGECPALSRRGYSDEHIQAAWVVLATMARAALADEFDLVGSRAGLGRSELTAANPMAWSALAGAALDASLRRLDQSLAGHLGAGWHTLESCTVLSLASSIDELVERAVATAGMVKVKIQPGWDIEPLAALRSALGDRPLAADANGSLDLERVLQPSWCAQLDEIGLAYLEQPCPGIEANSRLAERLATPICLDEPIGSYQDATAAIDAQAMSVVNVKPARLGGIGVAASVVALAARQGIGAFVGGMLETGIGRASALAVALLDGCSLPTDLGPSSRYFAQDLTEPIVATAEGLIEPPTGPGIGRRPDPARLADTTVERVTLAR